MKRVVGSFYILIAVLALPTFAFGQTRAKAVASPAPTNPTIVACLQNQEDCAELINKGLEAVATSSNEAVAKEPIHSQEIITVGVSE